MGLQMGPKRLDLVRQLVPNATTVALLTNPAMSAALPEVRDVQEAGRAIGIQINVLNVDTEGEINSAFATIAERRNDAAIIGTDPFLLGQRDLLVRLAAHHKIPTIYFLREFVEAGGLLSYGPNIANGYRQAGVYAGQILGGANPATLPVLQRSSHCSSTLKLPRRLVLPSRINCWRLQTR
jgi:putative ABC transport system substrate-binding protein